MEHQITGALERIENPILIILLAVLMLGIVMLWWQYNKVQTRLYDLAVETVGALKDTNSRLSDLSDQTERIEAKINSNEKN